MEPGRNNDDATQQDAAETVGCLTTPETSVDNNSSGCNPEIQPCRSFVGRIPTLQWEALLISDTLKYVTHYVIHYNTLMILTALRRKN